MLLLLPAYDCHFLCYFLLQQKLLHCSVFSRRTGSSWRTSIALLQPWHNRSHCDTTTTCPSINCSQRLAGDPWLENLATKLPGIAIISTHYPMRSCMGCSMHRYCIYSIIAHIIVSSIPSRYHMTWRTVWCLFFTALTGRWLGLGFARMLFLHVLGIMLSLCSWRHLELRHCSQKHIKRWLQYHKLSPWSKINVAVRYRFKQQHLMGHRVFQS